MVIRVITSTASITGRIYRSNRDMTQPRINQWPSLDAFLRDEVRRLGRHFDDRDRRLDEIPG